MKLLYSISNIDIYIDNGSDDWLGYVKSVLGRQLEGFCSDETAGKHKLQLIFKDYRTLDHDKLNGAICVPECSLYSPDDDVFIMYEEEFAYRIKDNVMSVWVGRKTPISMPFMLSYLLRLDGKAFVHAAAISYKGAGFLLLGFGGIGKTSFISKAIMNNDVKVLGDDMIIIDRDGSLHPYPRPFCLYPYHRTLFPDYFKNHKIKYRKPTLLRRVIRKVKLTVGLSDNNIYSYKTAPPRELFSAEKIQDKEVPIKHIYMLRRVKGISDFSITSSTDMEYFANFAVSVIYHEWYESIRTIFNELSLRGKSPAEFFTEYKDIVSSFIKETEKMSIIDIPEFVNADTVADRLNNLIVGE